VGGNTYVLGLLQRFVDVLGTTASSADFGGTLERLTDQLANHTATIALEDITLSDTELAATVVVESQVGHKFPSGYPARRTWLHFVVRDAAEQVVFESGSPNRDGSIAHNDNDADPDRYEPHHQVIAGPEQVQIYEAIMTNSDNEVTTTLLRGANYIKDNRLLPDGFADAPDEIAAQGRATEDDDFVAGGDRVLYKFALPDGAAGPFKISVELLYQAISYRWADNLRQYDAQEIASFLEFLEAVPNLPVVIAQTQTEVGD
jgi:hypothetical protein